MFSFHKPKIYRSNLGCCICKAKSSSSRFTDSKKYENEFERCFRIQEKRSGEICNACVLLVKRWKKLSPENRLIKHWHHVVDARAGPGTKLTGNRRLTNSSSSGNSSRATSTPNTSNETNDHLSTSSSNSSSNSLGLQKPQKQYSNANSNRLPDVLPLSANQANNQSTTLSSSSSSLSTTTSNQLNSTGSVRRRTGSWSSNKARAIDTNVSTFTFGEPSYRRNYMATEVSYSPSSSYSLSKPQSALNSSAFESVIKRFRQRQQQQQLEAERRQLNRQQRLLQQQQQPQQQAKSINKKTRKVQEKSQQQQQEQQQEEIKNSAETLSLPPSKRMKRSSESIGSLCVDGLRVSTILDNSIWRKEKICCGIIFRGLYNEVAVFPKLLKPCQARTAEKKLNTRLEDKEDLLNRQTRSPPPRATKSGSVSSCDSNTSGTGSMEQPLHESSQAKQRAPISQKQRRKSNLKPRELGGADEASVVSGKDIQVNSQQSRHRAKVGNKRTSGRKANVDTESTTSSSSSLAFLSNTSRVTGAEGANQQVPDSPTASLASSSGASSSRLLLMADDDELIMDEDEDVESNTDSSIGSLNEVEGKKSNVVI